MTDLVGALLAELAQELPEGAYLEGVRADLLAASRSYEQGEKKDLALRFYLAFRTMLVEFKRAQAAHVNQPVVENAYPVPSAGTSGSYDSGGGWVSNGL
ncbi:MAG TPA: hypothetical protein VGN17_19515 [Bryobacteraceae bacterium]|jgi:hypothetical protein